MPLLRIQRYKTTGVVLVDYFLTEGSYDAGDESIVLQLDPSLFGAVGNYAIIRTTGAISNLATPIGPTPTWTGGSHPSGYSVSAPLPGNADIGGTQYNVIYVTVSA
jgi:hypothetical protein